MKFKEGGLKRKVQELKNEIIAAGG
jgi:hypothetical protein